MDDISGRLSRIRRHVDAVTASLNRMVEGFQPDTAALDAVAASLNRMDGGASGEAEAAAGERNRRAEMNADVVGDWRQGAAEWIGEMERWGGMAADSAARGVTEGSAEVTAAMDAMSAQAAATAQAGLTADMGFGVGMNFAMGMASGISAGSGAVANAASGMVSRALASANAAADIHSPSRETYWSGSMLVAGYVSAIADGEASVRDAVGSVVEGGLSAWNEATWDGIGAFADLENRKLLDPDGDIQLSDADVKKIRELAEREVVNRFTTAKVSVQMTNNNRIDSAMDLDGIIDYLGDALSERLEMVAEGVYAD